MEDEELTIFQRKVIENRQIGIADYLTLNHFLSAREEELLNVDTNSEGFKLYGYMKQLEKKDRDKLYERVFERLG